MSERIPDARLKDLIVDTEETYLATSDVADIRAALTELLALRKDQADWRKGVGLIASALGENKPANLCCVRIANVSLALRAEVERLRAVEQAARKLEETCRDRHLLRHSYLWADLRTALDAIKQEPEKP